jgi:hypothetical protein
MTSSLLALPSELIILLLYCWARHVLIQSSLPPLLCIVLCSHAIDFTPCPSHYSTTRYESDLERPILISTLSPSVSAATVGSPSDCFLRTPYHTARCGSKNDQRLLKDAIYAMRTAAITRPCVCSIELPFLHPRHLFSNLHTRVCRLELRDMKISPILHRLVSAFWIRSK